VDAARGRWPWRDRRSLTAENLGFAEFFERLLRESARDSDYKSRWDRSSQFPLLKCPIEDVAAWRANRGLSIEPKFAITLSDVGLGTETREIARAEFYSVYWPLLEMAYSRADLSAGGKCDDLAFTTGLIKDQNPFWPDVELRSSRFAKQFVKDVLYCYLGLRGLAPPPWSEAILIELGECRRVGNKYTLGDATAAVENFITVLERLETSGVAQPLKRPEAAFFAQPVGSPPVKISAAASPKTCAAPHERPLAGASVIISAEP
jgi:hypothetical protein